MSIDFKAVQALFGNDNAADLRLEATRIVDFCSVTPKSIKLLNQYLRENQDIYKMATAIMYHGTAANVDIANQGILTSTRKTTGSLQSSSGFVCLSLYPKMALDFAKLHYPQQEVKVFAVEVLFRDLLPDSEQLFNKRMWSNDDNKIGRTLADSLVYGSGARVKRDIHPYQVRDVTHLLPT